MIKWINKQVFKGNVGLYTEKGPLALMIYNEFWGHCKFSKNKNVKFFDKLYIIM